MNGQFQCEEMLRMTALQTLQYYLLHKMSGMMRKKPRSTYSQSVSCVSRSVEAIKIKPRFVVALGIQQYSRTFQTKWVRSKPCKKAKPKQKQTRSRRGKLVRLILIYTLILTVYTLGGFSPSISPRYCTTAFRCGSRSQTCQ